MLFMQAILRNAYYLSFQIVFSTVQGLLRDHLFGRAGDARRPCGFPPAVFLLLCVCLQAAEGRPMCAYRGQAFLCQRLSQPTGQRNHLRLRYCFKTTALLIQAFLIHSVRLWCLCK